LRFDPSPGGERDEIIAFVVFERARGLGVVIGRVELQKLVGFRGEVFCRDALERCGVLFVFGHAEAAFVAIPSGEQRDVALFSSGENRFGRFRQEVAVDIGGEAPFAFQR